MNKLGGEVQAFSAGMAHPAALEQLTYYSEHKIHSLDFLFLLYHDKRNRGFAAYEARQGGVVGMIKRGFCLRLFAGGQPCFSR